MPVMLVSGTMLNGQYRIETVLGRGGMGNVYLASYQQNSVAVKEMLPAGPSPDVQQSALRQFRQEASLLKLLKHRLLPRVYDYFERDNTAYLVMEYIKGRTLASVVLAEEEPIPVPMVLGWADKLCDVLAYLHNHQPPVVFRDLKPGNIMLDVQNGIKLIDFGISKLFDQQEHDVTCTFARGAVSPGFTAPEQYSGGTDPRSDIYSLGATLYSLLARMPPPSAVERAAEIVTLVPLRTFRPDVSQALADGIEKLMMVRAAERPASIAEVRPLLGLPTIRARQTNQLEDAPTIHIDWSGPGPTAVATNLLAADTDFGAGPTAVPTNLLLADAPPPGRSGWEALLPPSPVPTRVPAPSPVPAPDTAPKGLASRWIALGAVVLLMVAFVLLWPTGHLPQPVAEVVPPASPQLTPAPAPPLHHLVNLVVSPVGAKLSLDGHRAQVVPAGHRVLDLRPGPHTLRITRPGFATETETITIDPNQASLDLKVSMLRPGHKHKPTLAPTVEASPTVAEVSAMPVPAPIPGGDTMLAVLLALAATSLFNIGMGLQKGGAGAWSGGFRQALNPDCRNLLWQWMLGSLVMVPALILQIMALQIGTATMVAIMDGFGLVVLTVFSALILKERVGPGEVAGMVLTVAGVAVGGYAQSTLPPDSQVHWMNLLVGATGLVLLAAGPSMWTQFQGRLNGMWVGLLAGVLGGCAVVTIRIGFVLNAPLAAAAAWGTLTLLCFCFNQLAYQHGRAVEVVPAFTAAAILGPILLGPVGLGESLRPLTGLGIGLLVAGLASLSFSQLNQENARVWGVVGVPADTGEDV